MPHLFELLREALLERQCLRGLCAHLVRMLPLSLHLALLRARFDQLSIPLRLLHGDQVLCVVGRRHVRCTCFLRKPHCLDAMLPAQRKRDEQRSFKCSSNARNHHGKADPSLSIAAAHRCLFADPIQRKLSAAHLDRELLTLRDAREETAVAAPI